MGSYEMKFWNGIKTHVNHVNKDAATSDDKIHLEGFFQSVFLLK